MVLCLYSGLVDPPVASSENRAITAYVQKVIDGDSLVVAIGSHTVQVRLWGIDTPEYKQAYSKAATRFTQRLVLNKSVTLSPKGWDKYGRMVALVQRGELLVNQQLLQAGLAWVHIYYCNEPICERWRDYEEEARGNRMGLWQQMSPMAPWEWKGMNKRR